MNSPMNKIDQPTKLVDRFGRQIDYIRLSVTDRCDFRCVYCMTEDMTFLPRNQILSLEELYKIAKVFTELGVRRIRLTGGCLLYTSPSPRDATLSRLPSCA